MFDIGPPRGLAPRGAFTLTPDSARACGSSIDQPSFRILHSAIRIYSSLRPRVLACPKMADGEAFDGGWTSMA